MKANLIIFTLGAALLLVPGAAWADRNPDFDDDAKPILRMQPGLLDYVESTFRVKDTGLARVSGTDSRPPQPPFLFPAKHRGAHGPYDLTLLIQPGPSGRVLKVINAPLNAGSLQAPGQPAEPGFQQPVSTPVRTAPAPTTPSAPQPSAPTPSADTPSGPIMSDNGSTNQGAPFPSPPSSTPNLEPPPDPAPSR